MEHQESSTCCKGIGVAGNIVFEGKRRDAPCDPVQYRGRGPPACPTGRRTSTLVEWSHTPGDAPATEVHCTVPFSSTA